MEARLARAGSWRRCARAALHKIPATLLHGCVGVECVVAHGIASNTHAIPKASHRSTALHCFLTAL
jgi:hypothetical protein